MHESAASGKLPFPFFPPARPPARDHSSPEWHAHRAILPPRAVAGRYAPLAHDRSAASAAAAHSTAAVAAMIARGACAAAGAPAQRWPSWVGSGAAASA
eukprot:653525-Prymnesium_polylepis.1